MNYRTAFSRKHQGVLLALLGVVFAPVLWRVAGAPPWLPDWLGAVIAVAGLFGILVALWRAGALRLHYLLLFAAALMLAIALGRLLT